MTYCIPKERQLSSFNNNKNKLIELYASRSMNHPYP